jgi:catechol 2,3-dioxygenase-like lactoylglutathione lyase family enzyme
VLRSAWPILYARDIERSVAFYELLGLRAGYRWPPEGKPQFVVARLGEWAIGIGTSDAPERLHAMPFGEGLRFELCAYVDDVDAEVERLRAAGVEVLHDPEDKPWGERAAHVVDPDGNPVQLVTELPQTDAAGAA